MSTKPNVLLFGLGGIGGVYACVLALSKQASVSVVARSNFSQVSEKGLRFVSNKFGNHDIKFDGGEPAPPVQAAWVIAVGARRHSMEERA